jgi:hypothetical protein
LSVLIRSGRFPHVRRPRENRQLFLQFLTRNDFTAHLSFTVADGIEVIDAFFCAEAEPDKQFPFDCQ